MSSKLPDNGPNSSHWRPHLLLEIRHVPGRLEVAARQVVAGGMWHVAWDGTAVMPLSEAPGRLDASKSQFDNCPPSRSSQGTEDKALADAVEQDSASEHSQLESSVLSGREIDPDLKAIIDKRDSLPTDASAAGETCVLVSITDFFVRQSPVKDHDVVRCAVGGVGIAPTRFTCEQI